MTEREAVDAIKKYAEEQGCTFAEYGDFEPAVRDDSHNFVVGWDGKTFDERTVTFFKIQETYFAPPKEIRYLKNLFLVHANQINGDLSWLGTLEHVKVLFLDVWQRPLPTVWACEPILDSLFLSFPIRGMARKIPEGIRTLKELTELDISACFYTIELPGWLHEFPKLRKLSLTNCYLRSIPYSVVQTGLDFVMENDYGRDGVHLFGVRLTEGNLSLFSQPREVIERYYLGRKSTAQECKVIFLGDGEAGKSSLIERIIHGKFEEGTLPTDGIRISKWETKIGEKPFSLRVLDFGGQEIMHAMHRCFLSSHTVYVVVCASRDDSEIDRMAARWLENVKAFAPGCPVILALNKADLNKNVSVNERDLKEINPSLRCVLRTSAKQDNDAGVNALIKQIQEAVPECVNNIEANADMLGVKRDLEQMEKDYISSDEYSAICVRHHIEDTRLQESMLGWFKDLGVAYSYSAVVTVVQVLNPAWLTNGIYRLILRTPEGSFLPHRLIREILRTSNPNDSLPEKLYSAQETEFILHVMRKFEISHDMGNGTELIPMKMKKTPPEEIDSFSKEDALHLRWEARYLPANLIHRLMIRKVGDLDKDCAWRTGARFRRDQCVALAEMNEMALDLYVTAPYDCRQYMQEFRAEIHRILAEINIRAEEVICCKIDGSEGRIPYDDVMQQWLDGMTKIYIPGIKKYVSPKDLLHEVYPQPDKEMERYKMSFNIGSIGNIGNIGSVGDGNTVSVTNPEAIIQGSVVPDDELIRALKDALVEFSKNEDAPEDERKKVKELLKNAEDEKPAGFWEKVRPFLGDAEKLAKILPFLATAAPAVVNFLTGLPH